MVEIFGEPKPAQEHHYDATGERWRRNFRESDPVRRQYSERIPAAIKHAKELLAEFEYWPGALHVSMDFHPVVLTAGEVALAEALWDEFSRPYDGEYPPALIAFVEKVEKLA